MTTTTHARAREESVEWRVIAEYPDYEVSTDGQVRRTTLKGNYPIGRKLKPWMSGDGYLCVALSRDDELKTFKVHRLVAIAFLGTPPSPKHEAAHGDGDRTHNHVLNLRWATKAENQADRLLHGTDSRGERNPRAKLNAEQVQQIRARYASGGITQVVLGAEYGVCGQQISIIVRGKQWLS